MSKKGGYKIVSLGGLDLLDENLSLKGLYDALKVSYGKPILLTGIVIDGELKKDALVQANEGANKIAIKNLYGYDLEVAKSGDAISVQPSPDGIELPVPTPEDDEKFVKVNVEGKYVLGSAPSPLPTVTNDDNGKVLEVVNGVWGKGGKKVNVIDAPSSTTLTDEQIAQIGEGVFINGSILGYKNPTIYPFGNFGDNVGGIIIGKVGTTNDVDIAGYIINPSKQIGTYPVGQYNNLNLRNLKSVNGKNIPNYPADTGTFTLKCINGTLTWVEDQA